jgi:uncharacterized protein
MLAARIRGRPGGTNQQYSLGKAMNNQYKLSMYLVATDLIDARTSPDPSRILYATRTGKSILLKDRVYRHLQAGDFAQISEATLIQLMSLEVIVRSDEDEFNEILRQNVSALDNRHTLGVTIQPTANCQLGCHYCGQQHEKKNVDAATSLKITDRICTNLTRGNYKALSVGWYGGEPLMAFSEILRMSDRLIGFCAEHEIGYASQMITNGLSFKPAVFQQLLAKKVTHFQITLDGLGETHDLMRITKEGGKTFDIILKNVLEVTSLPEYMEQDCRILIRINVNDRSVRSLSKLIDLLASHGLQHKRVQIDFAPIVDWGGNNAQKDSLTADTFADAEIDWMLHAIKKGFTFGKIIPSKTSAPCMVVAPDAEVYDAKGNIYPCYEYPYTPKYESPEYRLGHVDSIEIERNANAVTRNWFTDIKSDIAPCKTCNLFPVCGGGCPKQWYNGEVACPSFKYNIKDLLVLNHLIKKPGFLEQYREQTAIG